MSKAQHTPGPWIIEYTAASLSTLKRDFIITHSDENLRSHICRIFDASLCPEHGESQANARLIAAAPELLEALEKARDELRGLPHSLGYEFTHLQEINSAIAKAKGE